jgi:hypothetical protein
MPATGKSLPKLARNWHVFGPRATLTREKVAVREGIEPSAEHTEVSQNQSIVGSARTANTRIRAQITNALGRDLSQVVAAWSKIPAPLKAAILAIVNSSTASMEGES